MHSPPKKKHLIDVKFVDTQSMPLLGLLKASVEFKYFIVSDVNWKITVLSIDLA